jgi:tetratricopeptide (TPR) repeat protein
MTGFARVRKTIPEGEFVLSAKSVNHRALDLHFHLPPELDPFEASLRKAIKGHIARGHLQIHVSFSQALDVAAAALNKPLLASYLSAFQQAAAVFGLSGKPDLNVALRIPGMIRGDATPELKPEIEKGLIALMEEALELVPEEPIIISLQGVFHALTGRGEQALDYLARACAIPKSFGHAHHTYYQIACILALTGQPETAFEWLERSVSSGFACWPFFQNDHCLRSLHGLPQFELLVGSLQAKYPDHLGLL